jgi:hypothetical protein
MYNFCNGKSRCNKCILDKQCREITAAIRATFFTDIQSNMSIMELEKYSNGGAQTWDTKKIVTTKRVV